MGKVFVDGCACGGTLGLAQGENRDNINILRMSHARCHVQTSHNTGHTTQHRQKASILSILTMSALSSVMFFKSPRINLIKNLAFVQLNVSSGHF